MDGEGLGSVRPPGAVGLRPHQPKAAPGKSETGIDAAARDQGQAENGEAGAEIREQVPRFPGIRRGVDLPVRGAAMACTV